MAFLKLFLGPHYCDGQNVSRAKAKGGAKVEGLFDLPTSWTPPFVVVSLGSYPPDSNRIAELRKCLLGSNQWSLPSKLISKKADRVIVRSSANIEDIDARGWLTSRQSASGIDDVLQVFETVWSYSRQALDELDSHASLSLIIQRFHQPQLHGHLSNERRVSRSHKQWRFEIESPEKSAKTSAI